MRDRLSLYRLRLRNWWYLALNISIPIYVTRPDSDGKIGAWSVAAWYGLLALVLGMVALLLWLIVAIVVAIGILI